MNGFKTLVLQDLTHVLPSKSLPISTKLPPCNLHTAAGSRRFWNFFEFTSKDEVPRDSEQCQVKNMVPPEQIVGEMDEISQIAPTIPTVTAMTSMSMNPRMNLRETLPNSWNKSDPVKEDNIMSLLDGAPVPKTMKWKLTGYKTLRHQSIDDFAFVPGGKRNTDVDFITANTSKVPKSKSANCARKLAREVKKNNKACDGIMLSTKAAESKNCVEAATKNETAKDVELIKIKEETQTFEPKNSPTKNATVPASGPKTLMAPTKQPLSFPMTDNIKFLPISKPEAPMISTKHQSQPTAQYSSQPPDNYRKSPQHDESRARRTANRQDLEQPMENLPSDAYSTGSRGSYPAERIESSWKAEPESDFQEYRIETEERPASQTRYPQQRLSPVPDLDVDSYQGQQASNWRPSSEQAKPSKFKEDESRQYAPGPWKPERPVDGQTRYQKQSDYKSMQSVYESMGITLREGPPLNITAPDPKYQGKTSPCAATQSRMQQHGDDGYQQENGSYDFDGGSSMSGNGGGSKKPPPTYPPFTSRRSSSSNSSALVKPLDSAFKATKPANSEIIPASNISTGSRESAPRKCDDKCDDGEMIPGKEICTKPRENKCAQRRGDDCGGCGKKQKKQCKRYCCPALQVTADCDWSKSQCPNNKGANVCSKERNYEKPKTDPTCLPPRPEDNSCNFGAPETPKREACTQRRTCGKRENKCERRERSCNKQTSCKRERRSCERRERSCGKQQECERGEEAREICTKPRRRRSCDREPSCERRRNSCDRRRNSCERRKDSCDRDRRSTKCNRRNFTQSAHTRRPNGRRHVNRFFSMTTVGFSMLGIKDRENKSLFCVPTGRFYGKEDSSCDKPASSKMVKCKKPPAKCLGKSSESKSETDIDAKCGIDESSKCGIETKCKAETKCKTETKRKEKENVCPMKKNLCQTTCGKSEKKASCSKSGESDRCAKRRQQICKNARTSSEKDECPKDRVEREQKEVEKCKKYIGSRNKNKGKGEKKAASTTGLERTVSPCKRAGDKESTGCRKTACVSTPMNSLPGTATSLFIKPENDFTTNTIPERLFSSTTRANRSDQYARENETEIRQNDYTNFMTDDNVYADSGAFTGIPQQEYPTDTSANNWFLSWFH